MSIASGMSSPCTECMSGLPMSAKAMICVWTYLAAGGWYSAYMLIGTMGEAWRNRMFGTSESTFIWIVTVMFIASLAVIGMLFYGRFKRKQKDVTKTALEDYKKTGVFVDPGLKFDYTILPFWIGGSIVNVLASLCILAAAVTYTGMKMDPEVLYIMLGFAVAFFLAVISYMISELFANGVLDGKWLKMSLKTIVSSSEVKTAVKMFAEKAGMPASCVDAVYEKVNGIVKAKDYSELTPDEMIALSKAAEQIRAEQARTEHTSTEQAMAEEKRPASSGFP